MKNSASMKVRLFLGVIATITVIGVLVDTTIYTERHKSEALAKNSLQLTSMQLTQKIDNGSKMVATASTTSYPQSEIDMSATDDVFNQSEIVVSVPDLTDTETQIWQYCVDRWAYYDKINAAYSSDKYNTEVFNDASARFGITAEKAQAEWDKVDKTKLGLTN